MNKATRAVMKVMLVGMAAVIGMSAGRLEAVGGSNTTNLTVTVAPALSISVNQGNYAFGNVGANASSISTSAIVVTNDSSGRTENYQSSVTVPSPWSISNSTNGADTFMLNLLISSVQPSLSQFTNVGSTLGSAVSNLSSSYGIDQTTSCKNVFANAIRSLWFRFLAPSSTSDTNQKSIGVVLTAVDSSTF